MKDRQTRFLQIEGWKRSGKIAHGFGLRSQGGEKPIRKDWLGKAVQQEEESFPLISLRQVHEDRVVIFDGNIQRVEEVWREEGDSLITRSPGFALGVFTADCLPIFLYDPQKEAIGLVHAGWRGTARGVTGKAVEKMKAAFLCRSADIRAAMGPCIGPCCYEVDRPVQRAFVEAGFPWDSISHPRREGKWSLDLHLANYLLLKAAGVREENIEILKLCTSCKGEILYSYRKGDKTQGRQLNFIALRKGGCRPGDNKIK
jgi:YfiH family protein